MKARNPDIFFFKPLTVVPLGAMCAVRGRYVMRGHPKTSRGNCLVATLPEVNLDFFKNRKAKLKDTVVNTILDLIVSQFNESS